MTTERPDHAGTRSPHPGAGRYLPASCCPIQIQWSEPRLAPNPHDFPTLVAKLKQLDLEPFAWPQEDIRGIAAPTLLIVGDSDVVRLEHAVELFRLLGGGVFGDLAGLPKSQLAVLPGTTHFMPPGFGVLDRAEWLLPMLAAFLDAPMPEGN